MSRALTSLIVDTDWQTQAYIYRYALCTHKYKSFLQYIIVSYTHNHTLFFYKAELLQLKPHPFICMRNFIYKKVGNRKN